MFSPDDVKIDAREVRSAFMSVPVVVQKFSRKNRGVVLDP